MKGFYIILPIQSSKIVIIYIYNNINNCETYAVLRTVLHYLCMTVNRKTVDYKNTTLVLDLFPNKKILFYVSAAYIY